MHVITGRVVIAAV